MFQIFPQINPSLLGVMEFSLPVAMTSALVWTSVSLARTSKRLQTTGRELSSLAWIEIPTGEVVDRSQATLGLFNGSSDGIRQASVRIAPCIFDKGEDGLQIAYKAPFRIVNFGSIAANDESQKTDIWDDIEAAVELSVNNLERFASGIPGLKITACVKGCTANRTSIFTGEYVVEEETNGFGIACVREDLAGRVL